jgi:NADPH:quinone reductase-like Zn-dependent oxidoreductase
VVVNPTSEDLVEAVKGATDGAGVDVALDHVGGEGFRDLLRVTRVQGTIINIGRLAGRHTSVDLDLLAFRRLRVLGTTFSIRTADERAAVANALTAEVLPAVAAGRIRPIVDQVVAFDDAKRAAEVLRANQAVGKVVLQFPPADQGDDVR